MLWNGAGEDSTWVHHITVHKPATEHRTALHVVCLGLWVAMHNVLGRSSHEHQDRDARSCHQKQRNAARMPPQSVRVKVCLQVSKQVNNDLSLTCAWTQESLFVTFSASELSSCGMLPASGGTPAPCGGMLAK